MGDSIMEGSYAPNYQQPPPRLQQSAIRDDVDAFVFDFLQPYEFTDSPPRTTQRTTTTKRPAPVKQIIGGGQPQTLTGGAPLSVSVIKKLIIISYFKKRSNGNLLATGYFLTKKAF